MHIMYTHTRAGGGHATAGSSVPLQAGILAFGASELKPTLGLSCEHVLLRPVLPRLA